VEEGRTGVGGDWQAAAQVEAGGGGDGEGESS
jgi:hypothetical protein